MNKDTKKSLTTVPLNEKKLNFLGFSEINFCSKTANPIAKKIIP